MIECFIYLRDMRLRSTRAADESISGRASVRDGAAIASIAVEDDTVSTGRACKIFVSIVWHGPCSRERTASVGTGLQQGELLVRPRDIEVCLSLSASTIRHQVHPTRQCGMDSPNPS